MVPLTLPPAPLNVYVSAASRGLALTIAQRFAAGGANVAVSSRRQDHLDRAAAVIRPQAGPGARVLTVQGDLACPSDQERILDTLESEGFRPDVFICSCGQPAEASLASLDRSHWNHDVEMILGHAVFAAKRFAPLMAQSGYGRLVFVSSVYAKTPNGGSLTSSIARAGLFALSKAIVSEYASCGVASFPICLGYIDTPLLRNMALGRDYDAPEDAANGTQAWASVYEGWAEAIPSKRIASGDELAELVNFLVSPAAAYLNGTVLSYSGGLDRSLV
jgi:NAD(P)-dependent dehydrogenase (short-subunit alcohol dehydrogenase family)